MKKTNTRSAAPPAPKPSTRDIEFHYESPSARSVCLAGSFNNWSLEQLPMRRNGDGWRLKLKLPPGRHEYRFIVDGDWQNDPHACGIVPNEFGTCNCVVEVP